MVEHVSFLSWVLEHLKILLLHRHSSWMISLNDEGHRVLLRVTTTQYQYGRYLFLFWGFCPLSDKFQVRSIWSDPRHSTGLYRNSKKKKTNTFIFHGWGIYLFFMISSHLVHFLIWDYGCPNHFVFFFSLSSLPVWLLWKHIIQVLGHVRKKSAKFKFTSYLCWNLYWEFFKNHTGNFQ